MSLVSRCPAKIHSNKSNFSIEHILNVAGVKQNFGLEESAGDSKQFDWLNCTRYRPPKLPRQRKKEGMQRRNLGRNPRIPFSSSQVAFLEAKFLQTPYLSSSDVAQLASYLKLSETKVKIWFQNRRAREKREKETKSKTEENSTKNSPKTLSTLTPTAILPVRFPPYFPKDYSPAYKYLSYTKPDYLQVVTPLDLSDRQLLRKPK